MSSHLIHHVNLVNEGQVVLSDVLITGERIAAIGPAGSISTSKAEVVTDGNGCYLLPGLIDDQVHFREPGLTHKGDLHTESRAAVAGGITSYMEMPNTIPQALTQEILAQKYQRASEVSLANYSFFMGASNENLAEILRTDPKTVCGVKVFMGSSTGSMLVDHRETLEGIFRESQLLIATHCEDEATIKANLATYTQQYGDGILPQHHPMIRSVEACYKSSSLAAELREKYNARLHILHISTERELSLFRNDIPLSQKRLTAEACIHHLWFCDADYATHGNFIKWNPAIKTAADRDAILRAVLDNRIDVIATDHAPHTKEEKLQRYAQAPSGGPLVQHALVALLEFWHDGKMKIERIAEKTAHAVADCFQIKDRGYIREGYYADLVLVNPSAPWTVNDSNILYKCGWSPFENFTFRSSVEKTFVSGHLAYDHGRFDESTKGQRLLFDR